MKSLRIVLLCCLFMIVAVAAAHDFQIGSSALMAADEAAPAAIPSMSVWQILKEQAGVIGWLIIAVGVVMIALGIEDFVSIKRDLLIPPDVLEQIEQNFEAEDYEEAMAVCESDPSTLAKTIGSGLAKLSSGYDYVIGACNDKLGEELTYLNHKVSWVSWICCVATMLGLLGTVQGMIGAFNTIAMSPTPPKPSALAGNIGGALVTTFLGLIVAIPGLGIVNFFRNRIQRLGFEVAGITDELMARFRPENA